MNNRFDSKVNLISLFEIFNHYLSVDILSLPPTQKVSISGIRFRYLALLTYSTIRPSTEYLITSVPGNPETVACPIEWLVVVESEGEVEG